MSRRQKSGLKLVQAMNRSLIINTIMEKAPVSRMDIARITKLSPGTVGLAVENLIREGYVVEVGTGESNGGRKPILLAINSEEGVIIGADLSNMTAGLVNLRLDRIGDIEYWPRDYSTPISVEDVVGRIGDLVKRCKAKGYKLLGIGVGIPGIVDRSAGKILTSAPLKWSNVDFVELVRRETGLLTVIDANTMISAFGHMKVGRVKASNFIYITVGKGVGSALIMDGNELRGFNGAAGEFGYTYIIDDGKGGDGIGNIEALCSYPAIVERVKSLKSVSDISFEDIKREAEAGDSTVIGVLKEVGRYLGIGIANLINLFDPELVIIGGDVMSCSDYIMPKATELLERLVIMVGDKKMPQIVVEKEMEGRSLIGAADMVLKELFSVV